MSMIDYGCRFKINGNLHDFRGELFMDDPDGWVPEYAYDDKGNRYTIKGNYFAYAGDSDFFLCFYKTYWSAVKDGRVIYTSYDPFASETRFINGISIHTENIDKNLRELHYDELTDIDREFMSGKEIYQYLRHKGRNHNVYAKYYSRRYRTTFDYKGNHYDVIYGYGIDDLDVMKDLHEKSTYDFTDRDVKFLEEWFKN